MARCKCKICKKSMITSEAYKVVDKGKNTYYCSKEEYDNYIEIKNAENKERDSCLKYISEMIGVNFIPPMMVKEINNLREFYNYLIIEKTFKYSEKSILYFLNGDKYLDYPKVRYIMTIVKNNINKVYSIHLKEMKEKEKLFKKEDTIDIDIINNDNATAKRDVSDISDFLD